MPRGRRPSIWSLALKEAMRGAIEPLPESPGAGSPVSLEPEPNPVAEVEISADPPSSSCQPTLHLGLALIEAEDEFLLQEIRSDARTGRMLGAGITPSAALVEPGSEQQLLKQLLKIGQTPRVVDSR